MAAKNISIGLVRVFIILGLLSSFWLFNSSVTFAAINFESPVDYLQGQSPEIIISADFDNDGDVDLATVHNQINGVLGEDDTFIEGVFIHLNNDDGSFIMHQSVLFKENPVAITSGDFDNDGDVDLATANSASDDVALLVNDGNGTFVLADKLIADLVTPTGITSADLDNDDDTDIVITVDGIVNDPETGPAIVIFINDGMANFSADMIIYTLDILGQESHYGPIASDLNGDSIVDIATINSGVSIFFNNSNGDFSFSQIEFPSENTSARIVPIDIDNDSDIDFIVNQYGNKNGINFVLNDGDGVFNYTETINILPGMESFLVDDLDNDGDYDFGIPASDALLYIILQNDLSEFVLQAPIDVPYLTSASSIISADINNDGKPDIMATNPGGEVGRIIILIQSNQTPEELINEIIDDVINFEFSSNLENSYLANLDKVEQLITEEKIIPAINQLNAFIKKVNQDLKQGTITQEEATSLIEAASELLNILSLG